MIRSRKIDIICLAAILLAVIIALLELTGGFLSTRKEQPVSETNHYLSTDYEDLIFDDSYVHTIDIRLPQVNWDYMVQHATEEEYVLCNVVIDGEEIPNVAIRPKGNSSLSAIKAQGSDRFSFKIEFDHYKEATTYHGLDKLVLNNLGQDISCMKDFLTYHMMNEVGIAAPLSSYAELKLNGEEFGLYLAVEAVEDSFALRNYGDSPGKLYKPECFAMENVTPQAFINTKDNPFEKSYANLGPGDRVDVLGSFIRTPFEQCFGENMQAAALKYVGEDPKKYNVFWESAVFDITKEDKQSLINAIKTLNNTEHAMEAVAEESVIPYFVVHNFVNNYDSYSGIFVHNYYLREKDGRIALIPWDYNLAFGIFTLETVIKSMTGEDTDYLFEMETGQAMDDVTGMVNYPIDTPTITVDTQDRPLLSAFLTDEASLEQYHLTYQSFLENFFDSGRFEQLYQQTRTILMPYIDRGQTFYDAAQVEKGSKAIHDYCILRAESIQKQLYGSIPATMEGQREEYDNLVDASGVNLAASVTFDSLLFGIRSEDIVAVLNAIAGDSAHDFEGIKETWEEAEEHPAEILGMVRRALKASPLLQKGILKVLVPPVTLLLSWIVLAKALKRVKKYHRRKMEVG